MQNHTHIFRSNSISYSTSGRLYKFSLKCLFPLHLKSYNYTFSILRVSSLCCTGTEISESNNYMTVYSIKISGYNNSSRDAVLNHKLETEVARRRLKKYTKSDTFQRNLALFFSAPAARSSPTASR